MTIPGLLALFLCVFWPISIWYFERIADKSDEPLGVLGLIAFIAITVMRRSRTASSAAATLTAPTSNQSILQEVTLVPKFAVQVPLISFVFLAAYVCTWSFAPKLLSAVFAVLTIGTVIGAQSKDRKFDLGGWLLLLFSLPIVASLNFYSGYPLRLVVGKIAAPLISMIGFPTVADGTTLMWAGHLIQIDAPCSGIKMLWFALFVGAVLTSVLELNLWRSAIVLASCVVASLLGNVLRITSLFFVEARVVQIDPTMENFVHQAVGVVAFAIATGLTVLLAMKLAGNDSVEISNLSGETPNIFERTSVLPGRSPEAQIEPFSMLSKQGEDSRFLSTRARAQALILCALVAAATPAVLSRSDKHTLSVAEFPGWPSNYKGEPYTLVEPSKADEAFYREFPGKMQAVAQGDKRVLMRWIDKPTRQLHSSSDCFRGLGYIVTWKPILTDEQGVSWSRFSADKDGLKMDVAEHIYDQAGHNWTDVSSWYWAALMGSTHGPWRSDVEITRAPQLGDVSVSSR